jgi:hypothetical protein
MISTITSKVHWSDSKGHGESQSGQYRLFMGAQKVDIVLMCSKSECDAWKLPEHFSPVCHRNRCSIWIKVPHLCGRYGYLRNYQNDMWVLLKHQRSRFDIWSSCHRQKAAFKSLFGDYQEYPLHPTDQNEWVSTFCEVCFWKKCDQTRLKCDHREIQYATKCLERARLFEVRPKAHASLASQP